MFDQVLVHHLLGEEMAVGFTGKKRSLHEAMLFFD